MPGTRLIAYLSFDTVPAPKGAATHIEAFTRALAGAFGGVELVTAGASAKTPPRIERWPGVFHTELPAVGVSLIDRVLCFRGALRFWLASNSCELIQFRSIFEGFPLLALRPRPRLVFEVNGLPSIELKYRYPRAADDRELMRKVMAQERACLDAADRIVTPSRVTRGFLERGRGVDGSKIRVIPNGASLVDGPDCEAPTGELRLLYFGTLASWQGVDLAVRALGQVRAQVPARLTVLGVGNTRQKELLAALAAKLGISEFVDVLPPVERAELGAYLGRSFAVLAPLAIDDRNVTQGCCPLKILEGMAAGIPVIASDLPVVRELGEHGAQFLLVKPGSTDQIAEGVLRLNADRALWRELSRNGRAHIAAHYTWERSGGALVSLAREALAGSCSSKA
jgi:glycosyltransferase involved in cell wall biosynthesis